MIHEEQSQQQQMCSNTRNGGGGGGGCSKKQKQVKVPQRGPGVAELEKILSEQQKKEDNTGVEAFPSCSVPQSFPINSTSTPLPIMTMDLPYSYSLTRHVPLVPNLDLFNPTSVPLATIYGNVSSNSLGGGGSGGESGGGGVVPAIGGSDLTMDCPGHRCFPTLWSSCESSFDGEGPKLDSGLKFSAQFSNECDPVWHSHLLQQRKHQQCPFPMVNVWSSAGLDLQMLEPPSSQKICDSISMWPEEEKMVGMKRQWPFSVDSPWSSPFHHKVPSFFRDKHRPDQSSSCGSHSAFDSEPITTISRKARRAGLPQLKSHKDISDYGAFDGNFLTLKPPTTPLPSAQTSKPECCKFDFLQLQGSIQDPYQKSGPSGTVHQKPFHSFLPPKGQLGTGQTTLSLNNRRGESGEDSIDLSLKL